jgi:hypothetical protein
MEYVTQEQFQDVVNELLGRIQILEEERDSLRREMYDMWSDLEKEINYLERKCENE